MDEMLPQTTDDDDLVEKLPMQTTESKKINLKNA